MDKFVIHIHLYLTSTETELTAFNNLKRLKSNGFKILITSPKLIPLYFYQYIDHFYYDNENQIVVYVSKYVPESVSELNDIKGLVISDYQDYLDKKWIETLRIKYNVNVSKSELKKLYNTLVP